MINNYTNILQFGHKLIQWEPDDIVYVQDISRLLAEVSRDVKRECEDEIKEELFKYFWKRYSKVLTKGLPDWYKENLKNS